MKNSLYSLILIGFFLSFDANSVAHNGGNYNDRVSTECDSDCQKDAQINHQNILNWLENITSPVVNREESHSEYLAHLFEGRETNTTVVIANEKTFKNSRGLCLIKADLILKKTGVNIGEMALVYTGLSRVVPEGPYRRAFTVTAVTASAKQTRDAYRQNEELVKSCLTLPESILKNSYL